MQNTTKFLYYVYCIMYSLLYNINPPDGHTFSILCRLFCMLVVGGKMLKMMELKLNSVGCLLAISLITEKWSLVFARGGGK